MCLCMYANILSFFKKSSKVNYSFHKNILLYLFFSLKKHYHISMKLINK